MRIHGRESEGHLIKKYSTIYRALLRRIQRGTYPVEQMIPTERELTDEFGVTRNTVRRAIDELINDGHLYRKPGSGAFVCSPPIPRSMQRLSINGDREMHKRYQKITVHVLNLEVLTGTDIQTDILGLKSSAKVYHLQRIQCGDGKPIVYESIYLPFMYFSKITKEECSASVEEIIMKHALFDTSRRHRRIVVEAKESMKSTSSYLEVPIRTALLKLKITVLLGKKPYYYGSASYPGSSYTFLVDDL